MAAGSGIKGRVTRERFARAVRNRVVRNRVVRNRVARNRVARLPAVIPALAGLCRDPSARRQPVVETIGPGAPGRSPRILAGTELRADAGRVTSRGRRQAQ
jgi:hypothetical protein